MNDSWVIDNIVNAFTTWNQKVAEIWQLVMASPETFKGGGLWTAMTSINGSLKAIGYALLILFFAMSVFKSTVGFQDFKRPETCLRFFIRFVAAKTAVTYGMDLLTALFRICMGIITTAAGHMGSLTGANVTLPQSIKDEINGLGFFASIPLWLVTLLGSLLVTVLSFVLILTVYSRFFKIYMYTALAPIPLSTFAGEITSGTGKAFIKSYLGVCMEGVVIVLACVIFAAFASSGAPVLASGSAVTKVWAYLGETIFDMLVMVGLIKGADRIVKEMMDL